MYAPTVRAEKQAFLGELRDTTNAVTGSWVLIGDFNLVRTAADKNTNSIDNGEARMFNDFINTTELLEIPLLGRAFTWSSKRDCPTLVRLDRCFVNLGWDAQFPNTCLSSLTRYASDHVPILLTAETTVPKGACFRFENAWLRHHLFRVAMEHALASGPPGLSSKSFVKRLKLCRAACRAWARRLWPITERKNDTKILIDALDLLEEERDLSKAEAQLRRLATTALQEINNEKLAYWRQRFNLRMAVEWDENSRFFHTSASGRKRKNKIQCLEHDGLELHSHDAKSLVLFNFYNGLLGQFVPTQWSFSLGALYPSLDVAGFQLSAPFSESEVTAALFGMDANASPGPDGFGPSFYKAFWSTLKPLIMGLFSAFYTGAIDLDGLNRAYLVLLPKTEGARRADNFRPISLQNCPMKLFSKVMVNRLKPIIPNIVDADQTGFVHGRNIAENFIYAADLLSCCFKRKAPTLVLKLDFRKAFDSVVWDSLDKILEARGFDDRWRNWVSMTLSSGKTVVMLNGVPG